MLAAKLKNSILKESPSLSCFAATGADLWESHWHREPAHGGRRSSAESFRVSGFRNPHGRCVCGVSPTDEWPNALFLFKCGAWFDFVTLQMVLESLIHVRRSPQMLLATWTTSREKTSQQVHKWERWNSLCVFTSHFVNVQFTLVLVCLACLKAVCFRTASQSAWNGSPPLKDAQEAS